ncbi:hypothetical protein C0992_007888, partial [Termitomyces sp. T32_za158]
GSYFDSTLVALAAWPTPPARLSIVQDTPAPSRFAQPIVFFRLDTSLSLLIHTTSLTTLRIRIPARPITRALTSTHARARAPPLVYLDASTCSVSEPDVEALMMRYPLRHLVLDCVGLPKGPADAEWWAALGRRIVLAGVKKARERERGVRVMCEEEYRVRVRCAAGGGAGAGAGGDEGARARAEGERTNERRVKRGRRGLASATITLRGARSPSPPTSLPTHTPPSPSPPIISPHTPPPRALPLPPKIHILPPLPTLQTLCLSVSPALGHTTNADAAVKEAKAAFARGWREGVRVLWDARARVGASFARVRASGSQKGACGGGGGGERFLVFREGEGEGEGEGVYQGLRDVCLDEEGIFVRGELEGEDEDEEGEEGGTPVPVPVLCLAGPDLDADGHEPGCGHFVGREAGLEVVLV